MDGASSGSSLMVLIGAVFILIGLIFVPVAIRKLNADQASRSWPQTTATLERAEVMKYVVDRTHKDEGPTTRTSYSAALEYAYTVNGQRHVAQHGEAADDAAHAARLVAAHSLGDVLAHASRGEQLHPGELFGTGTLPGGSGMETGRWLRSGDALTLTIDEIGEIKHSILAS